MTQGPHLSHGLDVVAPAVRCAARRGCLVSETRKLQSCPSIADSRHLGSSTAACLTSSDWLESSWQLRSTLTATRHPSRLSHAVNAPASPCLCKWKFLLLLLCSDLVRRLPSSHFDVGPGLARRFGPVMGVHEMRVAFPISPNEPLHPPIVKLPVRLVRYDTSTFAI